MRQLKRTANDTVERKADGADLQNNGLRKWDIDIAPMSYEHNGVIIPDSAFARIVANDNGQPIGKPFARKSYAPISNARFLDTIEQAIGGAGHTLELIGTANNRARRFAQFKLTGLEGFTAGGRDFQSTIYFGDGLDQKTVWFYGFATRCLACMNQFMMAMRGACSREKHTINLQVRLPEIARIIGEAVGVQAQFANAFDSLAQVPVTREQARNAYAGFIGGPRAETLATRSLNVVDELENLFVQGRGNRGENLADLFSGVTDFYTHNSVGGDRATRSQRQFESSEFGTGQHRKTEFWHLINEPAQLQEVTAHGAALLKVS